MARRKVPRQKGCVVKRGKERLCHLYDEKKVYGSAYAACYVVRMSEKQCERVASSVMNEVNAYVKGKKEVRAHTISKKVASALRKHSKPAAFMYESHRDIN